MYLYPTNDEASKSTPVQPFGGVRVWDGQSTGNVAWLLASKRGFVPQYDMMVTPEASAAWRRRLGAKAAAIMDAYSAIHLQLETIAYGADGKTWTLYFPAGSG